MTRESLSEAIETEDPRQQLMAVRAYLVHELEVNRCPSCQASKLRTGDTAALVLRLTTILREIAELPHPEGEYDPLEEIQRRRDGNVTEIRPGASA